MISNAWALRYTDALAIHILIEVRLRTEVPLYTGLTRPTFKILAQECTGWGDGIDPELFVSSLHISVAIKASLYDT